ncbi:hypothetical protein R69888_06638 [Paraburkholderia haematera]|uniref:CopL family metal-binding regulatory protein n=2 Tax=Paraburkholderia haematera TaxID=2793077 RepID=A0ABN7MVQ5_9BURK|nr:hypothetical protein R69888_06638 [Paraburkholderia haematera]
MSSVWRILIVLSLALFATQGAFAHEHATARMKGARAMQTVQTVDDVSTIVGETAHCAGIADSGMSCHHDHSFCCSTSCGAHCSALLFVFAFEPRASGASLLQPLAEPQRTGVIHTPLLRPPIG